MPSAAELVIADFGITDPYYNLAAEEYLYNHCGENTTILMLWQNRRTVVIGQNQSAYTQCDISRIKADKVRIARRKSGGGAVYHDDGNLNFTFISRWDEGVCGRNMDIVCRALSRLGINAEPTGRNDITVQGKKVSGNAFYRDDYKICHHGTLLVDTDRDMMYGVLDVPADKWQGKGIDSARGRTINLKEINSDITVQKLKQSLAEVMAEEYCGAEIMRWESLSDFADMGEIEALAQMYGSDGWIYGRDFDETLRIKRRFGWGEAEIRVRLQHNRIEDCAIFSDCMEAEIISEISELIKGTDFDSGALNKAFETIITEGLSDMQREIACCVKMLLLSETAF